MPPDSEQFDALMARTAAGDESAVAELIDLCEPEIRRIARSMLGPLLRPHVDTVDVAQSVRLAIVLGVRDGKLEISNPDRLVGLAATLVRRKIADHWRKVRRRGEISSNQVERGDLLALSASASGESDEPNRIVAREDQWHRLLESLNDLERRLLELRLMGHSTAEVAELTGTDAGVLRVYLSRLRKRLREADQFSDWL